ncbi:hypothetical protein B6S44_24850, partial [Bosea sp. Tri-44]|uniref:hypothetical protein n=1 Tax=Bosea sp. Tri-44 TaxID=1972137 RepID=UPI0010287474
MSQEQFDALVEAIGQSVVVKLKGTAAETRASNAPAITPSAAEDGIETRVSDFVNRAGRAVAAFPELGQRLRGLPALIVEAGAGRGLLSFIAILGLSTLAALGAERLVGQLFGGAPRRLSLRAGAGRGLSAALPLLGIIAIDLLGLVAVWIVSYGALGIWFSCGNGPDKLDAAILDGILALRFSLTPFPNVLAHGLY